MQARPEIPKTLIATPASGGGEPPGSRSCRDSASIFAGKLNPDAGSHPSPGQGKPIAGNVKDRADNRNVYDFLKVCSGTPRPGEIDALRVLECRGFTKGKCSATARDVAVSDPATEQCGLDFISMPGFAL